MGGRGNLFVAIQAIPTMVGMQRALRCHQEESQLICYEILISRDGIKNRKVRYRIVVHMMRRYAPRYNGA